MNRVTTARHTTTVHETRKSRVPMARISNSRIGKQPTAAKKTIKSHTSSPETSKEPKIMLEKLPDFNFTGVSIGDPSDILDVAEYENLIYRTVRQREALQPHFEWNQRAISISQRNLMIDAMDKIHYKLELTTNTFYRFIGIFDRYLNKVQVSASKLKLVANACMLIAAKIEEIYPCQSSDLVELSYNAFTAKELFSTEIQVINAIKFDTTFATGLFFLTHFIRIVAKSKEAMLYSRYILEICQSCDKFYGMHPSLMAAVAVHVAQLSFGEPGWPAILQEFTQYTEADLEQPTNWIRAMLMENDRQETRFMRRKYGTECFCRVALRPLPECLQ